MKWISSKTIGWSIYALASLLLCIWLAWHLLAQANFFYSSWYSLLAIDTTIEDVAPGHKYKPEFEDTDQIEHERLFAEIVRAIHQQGQGLERIKFKNPQGADLGTLLTESEVQHLLDVAKLIDQLNWLALLLLVIALLLLALLFVLRINAPPMKVLLLGMLSAVLVIFLFILAAGPKKIFYWLHTQVFPKDHQWFFYYEDSLMSLLMKAPNLFAPIAILLVLLAIVFWALHIIILKKIGV